MPSDNEIRQLLKDPAISDWMRQALTAALDRDPVDAANDAALVSMVLDKRASEIHANDLAAQALAKAKRRGGSL